MGDPTFWDDPEKAQKTAQDVNSLKEEVDGFHKLSAGVDDLEALQEMAAEENDESLLPEMDELLAKCRSELEHLDAMDMLREGVGLRAYGQKDPLVEYKFEAYDMFEAMIDAIQDDVVRYIYHVNVITQAADDHLADSEEHGAEEV